MVNEFLWSIVAAVTLKQWLMFGAAGFALLALEVIKIRRHNRARASGRPLESPLEHRLLGLIDGAGLARPEPQYLVPARGHQYCVDFAYPVQKIAVEVDGAFHNSARRRALDRERDDALAALGWSTLRVTFRDLAPRPATVVGTLREVLGSRSGSGQSR